MFYTHIVREHDNDIQLKIKLVEQDEYRYKL